MQTNRFAGAAFDDSDDEPVAQQKVTKTQKKKEERKIVEKVEKVDKPIKFNANKMAEGGFEVVKKEKTQTQVGESRPTTEGRGGRGGRGSRGGADKPRTDRPRDQLNKEAIGTEVTEKRERQPYRGKPREEAHPFDRRSGTGRGRKAPEKKDGHGIGNWGDKQDKEYKRKGDDEDKPVDVEEPVEV